MYLLNQFLQPTFKWIGVNVTMIDKPITQLEVLNVGGYHMTLMTTETDHL